MTEGRTLVPGEARGEVLRLDEPLSFWGGIDPVTGDVIDPRHPQRGENVAGRVLVMPGGRGSSSSSSVLAEAIRARVAPAAIVLIEADPILALGAIVARELYGVAIPVVLVAEAPPPGSLVGILADADGVTIATS
jgi:predicted aconitase with swiveling domain